MIAPFLFAAIAVPFALAWWVAAWVVGDMFAATQPAVIQVRSDEWRR